MMTIIQNLQNLLTLLNVAKIHNLLFLHCYYFQYMYYKLCPNGKHIHPFALKIFTVTPENSLHM